MDYLKQDNVYFVFCEPRLVKADSPDALEKLPEADTFYAYEEIPGNSFQVYGMPERVAAELKTAPDVGRCSIVPYQAALRESLAAPDKAVIFFHSLPGAVLMTALKGKEVSRVLDVTRNLKESAAAAVHDYKAIFRVESFALVSNDRSLAGILPEYGVRAMPVFLNAAGLPEFLLPIQLRYRRAQKEKRIAGTAAGILGILAVLSGAAAYTGYTGLQSLRKTRNGLRQRNAESKKAFLAYEQENAAGLFTAAQKNRTLSIIARLAELPAGYSLSNLTVAGTGSGYKAEAAITVPAPGMDPEPLKGLFPDGRVEPCFSKNGAAYKVIFRY